MVGNVTISSTGVPRTQRQRSEATTAILVSVARDMFARDGCAATSLNAVVEVAGVTKGALYHHFDGKRALFHAVYQAEWRRLTSVIAQAYRREHDPWADASGVGSLAQIEHGLRRAMEAGSIAPQPVEPLTHIIHGAVCASAQLIAQSEDPEATMRQALKQLRTMLDAFVDRPRN